jgi:hypothetical protein
MLAWSSQVHKGDWLVARIRGFAQNVGSVVPNGFESYARLFHPIERGPWQRWAEVLTATAGSRTARCSTT